jgi:hypothetical protein
MRDASLFQTPRGEIQLGGRYFNTYLLTPNDTSFLNDEMRRSRIRTFKLSDPNANELNRFVIELSNLDITGGRKIFEAMYLGSPDKPVEENQMPPIYDFLLTIDGAKAVSYAMVRATKFRTNATALTYAEWIDLIDDYLMEEASKNPGQMVESEFVFFIMREYFSLSQIENKETANLQADDGKKAEAEKPSPTASM